MMTRTRRWPGHRCTRMGAAPGQRCKFCVFAAAHPGVEIIPFDARGGGYDFTAAEPYVIVRTARTRTRVRPQ